MNIYADAGAIKVWNNSYYTIASVYLSPSSDCYWGSDELSGYIYSGHTHSWRVSPGYWDIKVVDNYGDSATSYDNYIGVGCVYWFTFYGYNSASSKSSCFNDLKNKNNFNFDFIIKDLVEKCNRLEYVDVYNLK